MAYQCKHCGQTALDTDTVCWHCGQLLSRQKTKQEAAGGADATAPERPFPLASFAAYGGMTLFVIIALLVVMGALGQQPQVVQGIGISLKPGWTAVTDQNQIFTLNLPSQWQWLDRYDSEQEAAFFEQVHQNGQYQAVLAPYDEMADDRQLLFLAAPNQDDRNTAVSAFIIIARTQQLSQLSPEQMMALLQDGPAGITLLRSHLTEEVSGRQQVLSILTLPYDGQELRCQHLFFNGKPDSFVVAGCAPENHYSDLTNIFHDILVSFQPLLP